MAQIMETYIPAHKSIYDSTAPDYRRLRVSYALPDKGTDEETGILMLVPGFGGGNIDSSVFTKMRGTFPDIYNMVTVQCDYFGLRWMKDYAQELSDTDTAPGSSTNIRFDDESLKECCDMGFMQALDLITALRWLIGQLESGGHKMNYGKIIFYGSSHGAYLSYIANRICPGVITLISDNSSYLRTYTTDVVRACVLGTGDGKREFVLDYLLNLEPEAFLPDGYYYLPALYGDFDNKCRIICFHGVDDELIPLEDKRKFLDSVSGAELVTVDGSMLGEFFTTTKHSLGADFIKLYGFLAGRTKDSFEYREHAVFPDTVSIERDNNTVNISYNNALPQAEWIKGGRNNGMNINEKYSHAADCFEDGNYEEALRLWIEVYESGEHSQEILDTIYNCFITPNEDEFRSSYSDNYSRMTRLADRALTYEELPIDFIYVAENKYYLLEKNIRKFLGCIELSPVKRQEGKIEFGGLLVSHVWDIRAVEPMLRDKSYSMVYYVLDDYESYFMSFLKLPNFVEYYLRNSVVFADTGLMKDFFKAGTDVYLPKYVTGQDDGKYLDLLDELHQERLRSEKPNNNIFVSLCIPTYNRGNKALKNVLNTLELKYDSEIELIVSENGSTAYTEEYDKIAEIEDSRLVYWRFDENQGFTENVKHVIEMARGKFAVLMSDEDTIILDRFDQFMSFLYNHQNLGAAYNEGLGDNFAGNKQAVYEPGTESAMYALNCNYLTGTTINTEWMRRNNVLSRFEAAEQNLFIVSYIHAVIASMCCEKAPFAYTGMVLFDGREPFIRGDEDQLKVYMSVESRLEQQINALYFVYEVLNVENKDMILIERMLKTYSLLETLFVHKTGAAREKYAWPEVIIDLYNSDVEILDKYDKGYLYQTVMRMSLDYLSRNPGGEVENQLERIRSNIERDLTAYRILTNYEHKRLDWKKIHDSVEAII